MKYTELIYAFGNRAGLENLSFNNKGICAVRFDDDEIIFELNGNRLFVIADIDIVTEKSEVFHKAMLEGNHFGHKTGFSCLGLDRRTGSYTLTRIFEGEVELDPFIKEIELFVRALRYWKRQLNGEKQPEEKITIPLSGVFA